MDTTEQTELCSRGKSQNRVDEDTPMVGRCRKQWPGICRCTSKNMCISSKAALLMLFCTFFVSLVFSILMSVVSPPVWFYWYYYHQVNADSFDQLPELMLIYYGVTAFVLFFYPLGGYYGDVKSGRYETINCSLCCLVIALIILPFSLGLIAITFSVHEGTENLVELIIASIFGIIPMCLVFIYVVGHICFSANVIQFGVDQLHDSAAQESSLFIYWFTWVCYASQLAVHFCMLFVPITGNVIFVAIFIVLVFFLILFFFVGLITSYCIVSRKQNLFLIEPGRINPYRLVHKVSKFAYNHKVPVQRSAFTFCEDEKPKRLDLGKEKLGGPFTTEEVEDVKTFYGILKVLFALGPVFFLQVATDATPFFDSHDSDSDIGHYSEKGIIIAILHSEIFISPLLIVLSIPIYLYTLHPYIHYYLPGMLKRIGIGITLTWVIILLKFLLNVIMQVTNNDNFNSSNSSETYNNITTLQLHRILI